VSAAASIEIEAIDLDQPDRPLETIRQAPRPHSETLEIGDLGGAVADGSRGGNCSSNRSFKTIELGTIEARYGKLDVTHVGPEVKGGCAPAEIPQRDRGQNVLSGVLLHVIEASGPVELEPDPSFRYGL
jgi:hypothetical protein